MFTKPDIDRWEERGGQLAAGGQAQQLMPRNALRRAFFVQNLSTGDLWVQFGAVAVLSQPSVRLDPGGTLGADRESGFVDQGEVSIIGATTGQAFAAKEA
jgi:hypothetical protein